MRLGRSRPDTPDPDRVPPGRSELERQLASAGAMGPAELRRALLDHGGHVDAEGAERAREAGR